MSEYEDDMDTLHYMRSMLQRSIASRMIGLGVYAVVFLICAAVALGFSTLLSTMGQLMELFYFCGLFALMCMFGFGVLLWDSIQSQKETLNETVIKIDVLKEKKAAQAGAVSLATTVSVQGGLSVSDELEVRDVDDSALEAQVTSDVMR